MAVVVAAVALLIQALIVQLHWHAPLASASHGSATFDQSAIHTSGTNRESSAHDCVICLEQAMAGHYTLPPVTMFVEDQPRRSDALAPGALAVFSIRQLSHSWHSRGPPLPSV
jgi:hypothetical protein